MPYDVNLSLLFTELPLLERPLAAADAGFDAVEFWWPFGTPRPDPRDVDLFVGALSFAGVRLVALNIYAGDLAAGERGVLSHPDRAGDFRAGAEAAAAIGRATGCRVFNALYGNRLPGVDPAVQDVTAVRNLAEAARLMPGATVVVEPLNALENPDYPIRTAARAIAVCDRVREVSGHTGVKLLLDVYHLLTGGDDVPAAIDAYAGRIGHVQLADAPGRHQPGTGRLDVDDLLRRLDRAGYRGHIGLEYRPLGPSAESFGWMRGA
ncbi:hydroxypyruvate isomerase [Catenuloplanes nepalensis]|uniref:Hydroxypyruvate isomerase n=1 Tax=Catenuloplanes nepalensis TaxID=587533 RepID=A0ABT9MP77_9ACTN|nr:TIM barrel protein [Catenuloplanes nepalensis]MDP9793238.1 hydroxypyruvate isomerase [Catenuloplanes nepalensis]